MDWSIEPLNQKSQIAQEYGLLPADAWQQIQYAPTKNLRQHVIKTSSYDAKNVVNFTTETNRQRFIGQNWRVEMWNYAQNSPRFKDGSNPMISFDP